MKKVYFFLCICVLALATILLATDPNHLPSFWLIVPFILLFCVLWGGSTILLRKSGLTKFRSMRLGLVIAGLPVGLLLLQSIGQLTFRDIGTILAFFGLAYFYVSRATIKPEE